MDFLNAFVALANYVLVPGIAYGSQLALGALGVTLVYGILRFSNFAHGDTMALGAMSTVSDHLGVSGIGLHLWAAANRTAGPALWILLPSGCCWAPTASSIAFTARRRPSR